MNTIKSRTVYTYNNKDFNSLIAVKTEVENSLGVIIDHVNKVLPIHKQLGANQKLKILEVLTANKELVVDLLTVEFSTGNQEWYEPRETFNILDCK